VDLVGEMKSKYILHTDYN